MKVFTHAIWQSLRKSSSKALRPIVIFFILFAGYKGTGFCKDWVTKHFFACPWVNIIFVDCYSHHLKKSITEHINAHMKQANYLSYNHQELYKSLKERFDCIKKLTIKKEGPEKIALTVYGVKPVLQINNTLILGSDQLIYDKNNFVLWPGFKELPNIEAQQLKEGMKVTSSTYDAFVKMALNYTNRFHCSYTSPSEIRLTPILQERYKSIVTNEKELDNNTIIHNLDNVIEDALRRGACNPKMLEKKHCSVELDVRFNRRIIMKLIEHKRRGRVS